MEKTKITLDHLKAAANIMYAVGIVTCVITLLGGSDISDSLFWVIFGTVAIAIGAILKEVSFIIHKEQNKKNMTDEIFEAIKENMKLFGITDPNEIMEFVRLMEKYWMDFEREGKVAA